MLGDNQSVVSHLVEERTLDIGNNLLSTHHDYKELIHQSNQLYDRIKEYLPQEVRYLIGEYEKVEKLMQGIAMDVAFIEGIRDGARLMENI